MTASTTTPTTTTTCGIIQIFPRRENRIEAYGHIEASATVRTTYTSEANGIQIPEDSRCDTEFNLYRLSWWKIEAESSSPKTVAKHVRTAMFVLVVAFLYPLGAEMPHGSLRRFAAE
ncbi:Nitrogen regulatory protein areA [Anopheles sinensis]|uniref:Nitrogen regulatory protein areA n=1 Tax=Anopheles sinensis TaxID=74873 RepID=A0A084VSG8_ANOSI|nr:Nitrogen regulatory protein areA [Anopheles sinensis]